MKEHPCLSGRQVMRQGGEDQKRNGAWPEMFDDTFRPPLCGGIFWRELRGCVTVFPAECDPDEKGASEKKKKISDDQAAKLVVRHCY